MSGRERSPLRIIDAALNRAMEAVRVLDDAARFMLDDATLAQDAKSIRHDLRAIADAMPGRIMARDVVGDVGTAHTSESEGRRRSLADVAQAAGHRLAESLRSVEEWGKLIDPGVSELAKALRYRGYALQKEIASRLPGAAPQWGVCVLVTESLCRRPWMEVVEAAIAGGADCIQLREKSLGDRELLKRAQQVVATADAHGGGRVSVTVNDRADIALLAGADGVHVGEGDLDVAAVRALAGHTIVVGVSTHSVAEADAAVAAGADIIGIGTAFASATKRREVAGPALVAQIVARHPTVPHLAIGGIEPGNVSTLRKLGIRGVAVSGCVCGAEDPEQVVRSLADGTQ